MTYFKDVVETYYDTDYIDNARVKVIEMHIKLGEVDDAIEFFQNHKERFKSDEDLLQADKLIEKANYEEDKL